MKTSTQRLSIVLLLALVSAPTQASNSLYVTSNGSLANVAALSATGNNNAVSIFQTQDGLDGANSLSVQLTGDFNGALENAVFAPLTASVGLVPGEIRQTGHDNMVSLTVTGNQNLFAMSQIGSGNSLTAVVTGNYNQFAVFQRGVGNTLDFAQNGNGNMLSVVQRN